MGGADCIGISILGDINRSFEGMTFDVVCIPVWGCVVWGCVCCVGILPRVGDGWEGTSPFRGLGWVGIPMRGACWLGEDTWLGKPLWAVLSVAYSPPGSLKKRLVDCAWGSGALVVCTLLVGNADVCTGNTAWLLVAGGTDCC